MRTSRWFPVIALLALPGVARAGDIVVSPTTRDFGAVSCAGPAAGSTVTITNFGSTTTISGFTESGAGSSQFTEFASLPVFLGNGGSIDVTVTFDPTTRGSSSCTVTVMDTDSNVDTFDLTGTGTAAVLAVTIPPPPDPLAFDDQPWDGGGGQTLEVQIQNTGNEAILASNFSAAMLHGGDFSVGAPAFPIEPGATALVPVTFDPASAGAKVDTVLFSLSNDLPGDPNPIVRVTGTGTEAVAVPAVSSAAGLRLLGPNPISGAARFAYALPRAGRVRIAVYDPSGRLVDLPVDRDEGAGPHRLTWPGRAGAAPPGLYVVRLSLDGLALGAVRAVVLR